VTETVARLLGFVAFFGIIFSFLSIAVWTDARRKEREAFYRSETVKKIAESPAAGPLVIEFMREHERNASAIVELLCGHPAVRRVHYPGLATHPGHAIATRQQQGYGAMVSFELVGDTRQVRAFLDGLECFSLAESLGGVESLIAHPATMTHAAMDPEARRRAGIGDSLLRLSVGIEAADDLCRDLGRALDRATASLPSYQRVTA